MAVSVHTIAFKGPAGIGFVLLMLASIFYILGFGSVSWSENNASHWGLWQSCTCFDINDGESWFVATQVLLSIGLVGLVVAIVLATLYMCVHRISKNATLIALVVTCFAATGVMLIGIIIYGVKVDNLAWSFAMAVIGMCLTCASGVVSVIQMKQSDVPCCKN